MTTNDKRQLQIPGTSARLDGGVGGLPGTTREARPPSASASASAQVAGQRNPPPQRGVQLRRRTPTQVLATIMLETLERLAGEHAVGVGMADFYADVKPLLETYARGSTKAH